MEDFIDIQEKKNGSITTVTINGRLDAVSSPLAEKFIFDLINNHQHQLILEFSGVNYLSSAGMRMLLSTTKKLRGVSGRLVVCSVQNNVMDILKMSGFDHVLELIENEEEAIKKFQVHA